MHFECELCGWIWTGFASACVCSHVTSCVDVVGAGLGDDVTDSGLSALSSAGCGAKLTHLTLDSECLGMISVPWGV